MSRGRMSTMYKWFVADKPSYSEMARASSC